MLGLASSDFKYVLILANPSLLLTCKYFYEDSNPFVENTKRLLNLLGTPKGMFEHLDYLTIFDLDVSQSFLLVIIKDCNEYALTHLSCLPSLNKLFQPGDEGETRLSGPTTLTPYTLGTKLPKELISYNTIIPDDYTSLFWQLK